MESKMHLCFNALQNDQQVTLKFTSEKESAFYCLYGFDSGGAQGQYTSENKCVL